MSTVHNKSLAGYMNTLKKKKYRGIRPLKIRHHSYEFERRGIRVDRLLEKYKDESECVW